MAKIGIIAESDEIATLFTDASSAESYIEAQDVEDGTYSIAYDPDGYIYRIKYSGLSRFSAGKVFLVPTGQRDELRLRMLLSKLIDKNPRLYGNITINNNTPTAEIIQNLAEFDVI